MRVVKRNKRLWIDNDAGEAVYTPPDFIRLQSRQPMHDLAASLANRPYIDAVMDFEEITRQLHSEARELLAGRPKRFNVRGRPTP